MQHAHGLEKCLRVFVLVFSELVFVGVDSCPAHVRAFPSVMRKAFASFLFHLNQSAYEFFFQLHEVGSIYVDASVFVGIRTAYAGSSESLEVL